MPKLWINDSRVEVPRGATILWAARRIGIEIPTLCCMEGGEPFTSCMLCVVKDKASGRLLPACSAPAEEGMVVETECGEVDEARMGVLDLLLREHAGDCRAPCDLGCPAHADIPAVLRALETGGSGEALRILRQSIPFPETICGACPAPCESACRRGRFDAPVAIRLLLLHAARATKKNTARDAGTRETRPPSGKKVAILGAGITGLSAAYYLGLEGHECTVFHHQEPPGRPLGGERSGLEPPGGPLGGERSSLESLGAVFEKTAEKDGEIALRTLAGPGVAFSVGGSAATFDAVVIASGDTIFTGTPRFDLPAAGVGAPGVFSCGKAARPTINGDRDARLPARNRLEPVRGAAAGRDAARLANDYLRGRVPRAAGREFVSRLGALRDGELEELLKDSAPYPRVSPSAGEGAGFGETEAAREARRCLRCDCAKKNSCALRRYATRYGAKPPIAGNLARTRFERVAGEPRAARSPDVERAPDDHRTAARSPDADGDAAPTRAKRFRLQFEPGKCILCGICVRITESRGENPGLAFLGRGFGVRVGVPFDGPLSSALSSSSEECARACPTGALALVPEREERRGA